MEVDGPQFHQFPDEDGRKEQAWRGKGFDIQRISSDEVYGAPASLVALVA